MKRMNVERKSHRIGHLLAACAVASSIMVTTFDGPSIAAATGTVSGRVFLDGGADGEFNGSDVGLAGVVVRAFDSTGVQVGTATTSNSSQIIGTYTMTVTGAATKDIRVEFPTPDLYQSTLVSSAAASSRSNIQFVTMDAPNVNYGIYVPGDYCQLAASLASVCINQGSRDARPTERVLGLSSFEPPSTGTPPVAVNQTATAVTTLSTKGGTDGVGATWGLGWQKTNRLLWNSAMIRRHAALGPKGIGGVYVHNLEGDLVASFDLAADLGADNLVLKGANDDYSDTGRDIVSASGTGRMYDFLSRDAIGFAGVGMAGLGDLDVSTDGQYLWVTNLYERKIHRIALTGTASAPTLGAVTAWEVDSGHTCNSPVLRPWGLDMNSDGTVVVAAVCSNEGADPDTKPLPGNGVIMKLDPTKPNDATAWTTLTPIDFAVPHNYDYCSPTTLTCTWKAWSNNWDKLKVVAKRPNQPTYWWTQPMVLDVEQLADGSFVLGVSDRFSYQMGSANYSPVANGEPFGSYVTGWTAGNTLLICKTAEGWLQESDGDCAGTTTYNSSRATEFFYDEFGHPETTIGGLALGRGQIAVGAMDPASYFLSGIRWVSTINGNQTNALNLTGVGGNPGDTSFGKSAAIGDLESLCDAAPLQIGNRVWIDTDRDGIQDADEEPVAGVTVRLYDASSTLVGTAVTNASGEYYFTSSNTEAANGGSSPDEFGGGLAPNVAYTVALDNPDDCGTGGPLEGYTLTSQDQLTGGDTDRDNLIDSDASEVGTSWCGKGVPTVVVASMNIGDVNHSYDIGFWNENTPVPSTTPGSSTIPGSSSTTSPVSEANVTTTTTLAPTTNSTTVAPTTTSTPATVTVTPAALQVKPVSVGNFVWRDRNGDGLQGPIDKGLAGAVLRIFDEYGAPAVDMNGQRVRTQRTKSDGKYLFTNLPPGEYTVRIAYPRGWQPTVPNKPVRAKNSSSHREVSKRLRAGQRDLTLDFGVVTVKNRMLPMTR